jgi:hypothetical protein
MDFGGDKKKGTSLLHVIERPFIEWAVPRLPHFITSKELTLLSLIWAIGILGFGFLAKSDIHWFWGTSICIFLHWLTDSLDGSLGKARGEGLVRWGFYMDHLLDFFVFSGMIISYAFILPSDMHIWLLLTFAVLAGFMVNSFLQFGATNEFQIAYMKIGPTEIRLIFIMLNTLIILFAQTYLAFALPWVLIIAIVRLWISIYIQQKRIYAIDMKNKRTQDV